MSNNQAVPTVPKKHANRAGELGPLCFCGRWQRDHAENPTQCARFLARPCKCRHPYSDHATGHCTVCPTEREKRTGKVKACSQYRPDRSPGFLLRAGIAAGEWQFMSTPALGMLRGIDHDNGTRTLAVIYHSTMSRWGKPYGDDDTDTDGPNRARRAMTVDAKTGKIRDLQPGDIVNALNEVDPLENMDRFQMSRILQELKDQGYIRLAGKKTRAHRTIYAYLKPRTSKCYHPRQHFDPKNPLTEPESSTSSQRDFTRTILPILNSAVKTMKRTLKEAAASNPNVVIGDNISAIEEASEAIGNVVTQAYIRMGIVVAETPALKETTLIEVKESIPPSSSSSEALENPPQTTTTTTAADPVATAESTPNAPTVAEPENKQDGEHAGNPTAIEPDRAAIAEAFSDHATPDDGLITALITECTEQTAAAGIDPPTTAEIVHFTHAKAHVLNTPRRSPGRFLVTSIVKCFRGESFLAFRHRQAKAAAAAAAQVPGCRAQAPQAPAESIQDPDPPVSTRQCGECGGLQTTYQSGFVSLCRCKAEAKLKA
jgi:hypothetical protein